MSAGTSLTGQGPSAAHTVEIASDPKKPGKWRSYLTPILVLLLAAALTITLTRNWNSWEGGRADQTTNDSYVRGDLTPLSTKVTGIVRDVKVEDYQHVHKGDVLVELEDEDYKAVLAQANAAVTASKAAIENNVRQRELQDAKIERALAGIDLSRAQIAAAQAGMAAAHADVGRTQSERTRQESLLQTKATTQQKVESAVADEERFSALAASRAADLEQAKASLRSNESAVEGERRGKTVLESQKEGLIADLHAKEAQLAVAQINLGYTRIVAPGDGTVGERQVRPGQLVTPGTQVLTFVDSARWVQANYRETQLTHMQIGDAAEIRIDLYPDRTFRGKVMQIAPASGSQFALLPPDNATGNFTKVVQRVPVKIAIENSDAATQLRPGLSAVVTVKTGTRTDKQ
jgi:membrane fusion protein, multidrug efflux system